MFHLCPLTKFPWKWLPHLDKVSSPGREKQNDLLDGEKTQKAEDLVTYRINSPSKFYTGVLILLFTRNDLPLLE